MAFLTHTCPHCRIENVAMQIRTTSAGSGGIGYCFLTCNACDKPACCSVIFNVQGGNAPAALSTLTQLEVNILQREIVIVEFWPAPLAPEVPKHLPPEAAKPYLAAERNFHQDGMEEASAGSYGRALDVGTKRYAADLADKTLYVRIKTLADQGRITRELADWAHQIRVIRNDALHDVDEITRDELMAVRDFSNLVLTYLFTLPKMLELRKAETEGKTGAEA